MTSPRQPGAPWRVAIIKDTSRPMFGLHGLHVAFRGLPDVEVVAHVDDNPQDLPEKMRFTQARRHYPTIDQMLAHESPDIAVLCSRHPQDHLPQIRQLASRGCHLYCEKPLARTLTEADQIAEVGRRHGVQIAMAHLSRHWLAFVTLKRMVEAGDIGRPVVIHGRGKSDHRGGGEDLVTLGTHILDYMAFLAGPPVAVWADVTADGLPIGPDDGEQPTEPIGPVAGDSVMATFLFAGGVRGLFESHRDVFEAGRSRGYMGVTVTGTKGALSMRFADSHETSLMIHHGPCAPEAGVTFEEVPLVEDRVIPGAQPVELELAYQRDIPSPRFLESNRHAVWDLMCAIEQGRPPRASVQDACITLEMIQGIYTSHLTGRRVSFPLADRAHPLGD